MGVSVVIPSYERPQLLRKLLKSISAQTYRDFEVIVVDDHSQSIKEIQAVIAEFENSFPLTFLRNEERKGAPHSRNRGIRQSRYGLIALVDDDDAWLPEKLSRQVSLFNSSSHNLGLVYTWTKVLDPDENLLKEERPEIEGTPKKEILRSCFISSPSVMVRKESIIKSGLFDETFPSCQDWDTWTRMIHNGFEVKVCKEFLTLYYKHGGPTIGTSPHAKKGFVKYYTKHFWKLVTYGEFRHLVRMVRFKFNI